MLDDHDTAPSSPARRRWLPTRSAHVAPWLRYLLVAALAAGTVTLVSGRVPHVGDPFSSGRSGPPHLFAADQSYNAAALYKGAVKATVYVDSSERSVKASQFAETSGSGFAIDGNGDIVTNAHVVAGAKAIWVETWDGQRLPARLVGSDPSSDVAVLHIARQLPVLALATSSSEVGDDVLAIGNPLGERFSASTGIISGLDRDLRAPNGYTITGVVQTTAVIDHGSSGGPLLDARGRVVGITSAMAAEGSGIGYVIPAALIRKASDSLIRFGSVAHAWLGVTMAPLTPPLAQRLGLPASHGALIETVAANSPAARAGLRGSTRSIKLNGQHFPVGGDLVVAAGSQKIGTSADLAAIVNRHGPGSQLVLTVLRGQKRLRLAVRLAAQPAQK